MIKAVSYVEEEHPLETCRFVYGKDPFEVEIEFALPANHVAVGVLGSCLAILEPSH